MSFVTAAGPESRWWKDRQDSFSPSLQVLTRHTHPHHQHTYTDTHGHTHVPYGLTSTPVSSDHLTMSVCRAMNNSDFPEVLCTMTEHTLSSAVLRIIRLTGNKTGPGVLLFFGMIQFPKSKSNDLLHTDIGNGNCKNEESNTWPRWTTAFIKSNIKPPLSLTDLRGNSGWVHWALSLVAVTFRPTDPKMTNTLPGSVGQNPHFRAIDLKPPSIIGQLLLDSLRAFKGSSLTSGPSLETSGQFNDSTPIAGLSVPGRGRGICLSAVLPEVSGHFCPLKVI